MGAGMSRRRAFTDEECRDLAAWYEQLQSLGTVFDKCREHGVTYGTLRDAILRGQGKDVGHVRRKLKAWEIEQIAARLSTEVPASVPASVPRESETSSQINSQSAEVA